MALEVKEVKRSGFLSQLINGKPSYAKKSVGFTSNFFFTMLSKADTTLESHRVMTSLELRTEQDNYIKSATASRILGMDTKGLNAVAHVDMKNKKRSARQSLLWGISLDTFYFQLKAPSSAEMSYQVFHYSREAIFRSLKIIDILIRLPAIIFAALQMMFERVGWIIQSAPFAYLEEENTVYTRIKAHLGIFADLFFIPAAAVISSIGFALNVIGAVIFRSALFATKIAADAIRVPLALMGAVIGLIFGSFVAAGNAIHVAVTKNDLHFNAWYLTCLMGISDGIRPFAPEAANSLLENLIKMRNNHDNNLQIRAPFEPMPTDSEIRQRTLNIPWFSLAMFAVAVVSVIVLSTATIGFGGLLSMPLLPYLFHATGIASGEVGLAAGITIMKLGPVLSKLCMTAMGLMSIGAIQATLVGLGRGIQAFFNDLTTNHPKPSITKPILINSSGSISSNQNNINQDQNNDSTTIIHTGPNYMQNNNKNNKLENNNTGVANNIN